MDIADATTGVPSAALVTRAKRRKFTPEFKRQVAAQCLLPGASLSAVALSHRINANVIRKWVRRAQQNTTSPTVPSTATMLAVNVMQAPVHKPPPPSRTDAGSSAVPCIEILTAAGTVRLAQAAELAIREKAECITVERLERAAGAGIFKLPVEEEPYETDA